MKDFKHFQLVINGENHGGQITIYKQELDRKEIHCNFGTFLLKNDDWCWIAEDPNRLVRLVEV